MTLHIRQILSETWHGLSCQGRREQEKAHERPCFASTPGCETTECSLTGEEEGEEDISPCTPSLGQYPDTGMPLQSRPRVCIVEAKNKVHNVPDIYTNLDGRWYNKQEILGFKKETLRYAYTEQGRGSW